MRQEGSRRWPGRLLVIGLLIPCLLVAIPAFVGLRARGQMHDSFGWVTHTLEVQRQLQRLMSLLVDAETGQRGFLLTSREVYLEPYRHALGLIGTQLDSLRTLTADNPRQQERDAAKQMAATARLVREGWPGRSRRATTARIA